MEFKPTHHTGESVHMRSALHHIQKMLFSLIVVLLAMHVAAFFVFSFVESNEIQHEMIAFHRSLAEMSIADQDSALSPGGVRYDDGYAIIPASPAYQGFYATSVGGVPYFAYADHGSPVAVAKRADDLNGETERFAYALGAIFFGELLIMAGWWFSVRASVRALFTVE